MENGRHRIFNFATLSFDIPLLNNKMDCVFEELKCAAKVDFAFGFFLKNIEDGICRYFYAHKNHTIMERSKLVCTQIYMTSLKRRRQEKGIVDICTRERADKKWKIYKLTKKILLRHSKMYPWAVKIQSHLNKFWEAVTWTALLFRETRGNPTMTISDCLEHQLYIGMVTKNWREDFENFNLLLNNSEEREVSKFQDVPLKDILKVEDSCNSISSLMTLIL